MGGVASAVKPARLFCGGAHASPPRKGTPIQAIGWAFFLCYNQSEQRTIFVRTDLYIDRPNRKREEVYVPVSFIRNI